MNALFQLSEAFPLVKKFTDNLFERSSYLPDNTVTVDAPIVWLGCLPRTGGTMILRAFDNHKSSLVCIRNLRLSPSSDLWDFSEKSYQAQLLKQLSLFEFRNNGFRKTGSEFYGLKSNPIYFDQSWFNYINSKYWSLKGAEWLMGALTAHFNAYRNFQNLYGKKKCIFLHSPFLLNPKTSISRSGKTFSAMNPSNVWLVIFRHPGDWLNSVLSFQNSRFGNSRELLESYCDFYTNLPANTVLVCYEDFVSKPRSSLKKLARRLGLDFDETLMSQTVNGQLVGKNTGIELHKSDSAGIDAAPVSLREPNTGLSIAKSDYSAFSLALDIYEKNRAKCT